jgi:Nuclease-related domain
MTWTQKPLTRNAATCSSCGGKVEKNQRGWINSEAPAGKRVRCLACGPGDTAIYIDPVAGSSALRLDAHRRGDNFLKGAHGEYLMGGYLSDDLDPDARVLTDRNVPGESEANIDHVVVASSGVWIIDSKKWTGEIHYRSRRFPSTDPRRYLFIGGEDRTAHIAKIFRLVIPVAQVIADRTVPVHPVMAFVEPIWGVSESLHFKSRKGPYVHEGVFLSGGRSIIGKINEPGPLSLERIEALFHKLNAAMPPR